MSSAVLSPCLRAGRGDEGFVDVLLAQRHVGAVLAVKDQRKPMVVADAKEDKRGQPRGVGLDALHIDPLARKFLADEAAHVFVADPRDDRRFQPEPRRPRRDVGGRAADILAERPHILKPPADLHAIEIDRGPADGDDVERLRHVQPLSP